MRFGSARSLGEIPGAFRLGKMRTSADNAYIQV